MKLSNRTAAAAQLFKTGSPNRDDRMLGCVIARPTYVVKRGELVPTPDQPWPISAEPTDTPLGKMPGDRPVYSGGVDILVGGSVRPRDGLPARRLDVELEVGRTFRRRIAVFGERRWVRGKKGALEIGEPEPFLTMDLRYQRAFGGLAKTERGPVAYSPNAGGKGFYLDEKSALDGELPNLEDPNQLIQRVDDYPEPVGLGYYPMDGALRFRNAVDHPLSKMAVAPPRAGAPAPAPPAAGGEPLRPDQMLPTLFNMAHPKMILPAGREPKKGEIVRLSHGVRDGDLTFPMPETAMHVHVQLADRQYVFPLYLDQIGIVAGEGRVFFSLRCVFEYRLVKGERRRATLYEGPVPEPVPPEYRAKWSEEWDKGWWDEEDEEEEKERR
jgi:hypothetical protein